MRRSKYGNVRVTVDGHKFDSKREARRYGELKLLQRAGKISDLLLQVRFPLVVNGHVICAYIADFDYREGSYRVTEDVKGVRTAVYRIKAKLMKALHGVTIREIE